MVYRNDSLIQVQPFENPMNHSLKADFDHISNNIRDDDKLIIFAVRSRLEE